MESIEARLKDRYEKAGQQHVFQYFHRLSNIEKEQLLMQLDSIQIEEIPLLVESARIQEELVKNGTESSIRPFTGPVGRSTDTNCIEIARIKGMECIRKGQVAALVLAGGQGTRLGFSGPKGMYNIGLQSGRTLFQLMSERLKRLSQISANSSDHQRQLIPFYIMTSPLNHDETVEYFKKEDFFGLGENNVFFFRQGMLPCVTIEDSKLIMESAGLVAMAPDGNGGIYPSLKLSGALDDMKNRGILYLHVFSIDNALVKPADPVFIGYCVNQEADCGNKVVWKAHPHEAVGVVAEKGNKPCIVEYSEITKELAESTNEEGTLVFGAANICNHFYTIDFLENKILPNMGKLYHIAKKKIPYFDSESDETVTPVTNNGIKLELFIFDVFPLSERMAVLEVERSEEFAPVKNSSGADSPDSAKAMMSALSRKYIIEAGGQVIGDSIPCEISPLISYGGEGLEQFRGKVLSSPFSI